MNNPMKTLQRKADSNLARWLQQLNHQIISWDASSSKLLNSWGVPALLGVRRAALLIRQASKYKIYRVKGVEQTTGKPLTVLYLVEGKSMEYFHHMIFEEGTVIQEPLGSCSLWNLPQTAGRLLKNADMVIVEGDQNWKPDRGEWLRAPIWVRMVFSFRPNETWDQLQLRLKPQQKNIRKVLKAGFTSRVSREDADFDFFYERMHVPLIRKRHKNYGIVDHKHTLYQYFKRGFLSLVLDSAGQTVGGDICVPLGDTLWAYSTGVLDGDNRLIDAGVQSALYYYSFKLALDHGASKIDVGECRPFQNDGVYTYKVRWGFEACLDPWQPRRLLIWIPDGSEVARAWVEAHPFIPEFSQKGGKLHQSHRDLRSLKLEQE